LAFNVPQNGSPVTTIPQYDDGTSDYCSLLRQAARWHTESFSFQSTVRTSALPVYADPGADTNTWGHADIAGHKVGGGSYPSDDDHDAYALYAFDLPLYTSTPQSPYDASNPLPYKEFNGSDNIAYDNSETGVKVTYFPAIHTRVGSISYKLEWKGLSMIFTGDTKPNYSLVNQAASGVDVLVHEIASPASVWVEKFAGLQPGDEGYQQVLADLTDVQESSHTPQKMFGYILKLIKEGGTPPRLAVGTHFAATDDVIRYALSDIRYYYPTGDIAVASDLMVINVTERAIRQRRAVVSDYVWGAPEDPTSYTATYAAPKYWAYEVNDDGSINYDVKVGDPYAQIDDSDAIPQPDDYNG
jgi:ribonuclease Z